MPDPDDNQSPRCHNCGASVPADAPGKVCTACLITSILGDPSPPAQDTPPAESTARIPGFDLLEKIGEGGFGVVYAANQIEPVQRKVAIKILKQGFTGSEPLARFEAERQALALMDHPGIAHVYDAGETTDGQPYFVMELIDGLPITSHCNDHHLHLDARLALFIATCHAIGHAHHRGIIHRDLKPSNILVQSTADPPAPKVIDFGIAKATESLLTDRTLLTLDNQIVGTPSYMSPEQAAQSGIVDTRSDIYSLGVLLYELVTGTPPFRDSDLQDLAWDEALKKIRTESPPRPSARLRSTQSATAPLNDLDWIVMRAIEKDPQRRYQTADALAADIIRYQNNDAVEARPPSSAYRLQKFVTRHRLPVTAALAVAAALIVGTLVSLTLYFQAEQNAENATLSDLHGRQQFSRADFTQASLLMDEHPAIAVAHLARSLRSDPTNRAAASLLTHALASNDWPSRSFPPFDHGSLIRSLDFTPDGSLLLITGDNETLEAIDPTSGNLVHKIDLGGAGSGVVPHPQGTHVAVSILWNGFAVIDLHNGQIVASISDIDSRGCTLSWSPDGTRLAAAFDDGSVHGWSLGSTTVVQTIPTSGSPRGAIYTPDGTHLLITENDTLRLWDPITGTPTSPPLTLGKKLSHPFFTPDGKNVVVKTADTTIHSLDLATLSPTFQIKTGTRITALEISPDGALIAAGDEAGLVQCWNATTGRPTGIRIQHTGIIRRIKFSPDGTLLATGAQTEHRNDAAVKICDTRTGTPLSTPIYHPRGAGSLAFHPDGQHIAVGSRSRLAAVWKLVPSSMAPVRIALQKPVWRIGFDRASGQLLALTSDGEASAFDPADGHPVPGSPQTSGPIAVAAHAAHAQTLRHGFQHGRPDRWPHPDLRSAAGFIAPAFRQGRVNAAAASGDGKLLATACNDGLTRLWSLETGTLIKTLGDQDAPATAVAFSTTAHRIATGSRTGHVTLWSVAEARKIHSEKIHTAEVIALSLTQNGAIIASGSHDQTARLVSINPDGTATTSPPLPHNGRVSQLAFSPGGDVLATSSQANNARLWSVADHSQLTAPLAHLDIAPPYGLLLFWPSDHRLLTTGSHDNTSRLWDTTTGRLLSKPMPLPSGVKSAALSPDRRVLLTGGDFGFEARTWDLETGEPLTALLPHDGRLTAGAFAPDGKRIATATLRGSIQIHSTPSPGTATTTPLIQLAESIAGFRFNADGILEDIPPAPPATLGTDPWSTWLTDSTNQKTISPHSSLTLTDYIAELEKIGSFREALHRNPGSPILRAKLGAHLLRSAPDGSHDQLLGSHLVTSAHTESPTDPAIALTAASAWVSLDRQPQALRLLANTLSQTPNSPELWFALGETLASTDSLFAAATAYRHASAIGPHLTLKTTTELASLTEKVPRQRATRWKQHLSASPDTASLLNDLQALNQDDPIAAVHQLAATLADTPPDDALPWARLATLALAAAELHTSPQLTGAGFAALTCAPLSRDRLQSVSDQLAPPDEQSPWLSADSPCLYLKLTGDQRLPSDVHQTACDTTHWKSTQLSSLDSPTAIRATFTIEDPSRHTHAVAIIANAGAIKFFLNGEPLPEPTDPTTITIPTDRFQKGNNTLSASGTFPDNFVLELSPAPLTIVARLRDLDITRAAKALGLDPTATAWLQSERATAIGDHQTAAKHLAEVIRTHPRRPQILNRLGVAQYRIDDKPAAVHSFEQAIETSPLNPEFQRLVRGNLVHTLRQLGRHDQAHPHWLAQHSIKPRDPILPHSLINLTPHFNAPLDRDPVYPGSGNAFSDLEPRDTTLAGIHFDIRALVLVNSSRINGPSKSTYPESVRIGIKKSAYTLHFLHAAFHTVDPAGTKIGTYRIHYANGTTTETPIVVGENTRDWWLRPDAEIPADLPKATLAWTGTNPHIGDRDIKTSLYIHSWTNPRPDIQIDTIELISAMQQGAPFLAALTIDPVE